MWFNYRNSRSRRLAWISSAFILLLFLVNITSLEFLFSIFWFSNQAQNILPCFERYTPLSPEEEMLAPIPRIVHQTWKTENIPPEWEASRNSWLSTCCNYTYMFWTDKSIREFISAEFPWFLSTFDSYPYDIQRIDAARILLLYYFGGIYSDLDIIRLDHCNHNINELRRFDAVLPQTKPLGVSNDFMMAAPRHPFFLQLVNSLTSSDGWWLGTKYLRVMLSTGPLFITFQLQKYNRVINDFKRRNSEANEEQSSETHFSKTKASVYVLPNECYGGNNCFLKHVKGNSWHGLDAVIILSFYNYPIFSIAISCIILFIGLLLVMLMRSYLRSRSHRWSRREPQN